ncbi:hypothetical protein [Mitsuaria sp. GD03876]|uniref:hypothetical protein n=1 Tax=Mitsuaria sp. GD03876 TaxID=2975399 RepID=UPI002449142F|nr:hypothetical protein [Mitsuaria sp. GD03876]MDH0866608.1 hypothetical protein [Mitsuaria sp. GD03876]
MTLNALAPRGPMAAPVVSDPDELRLRGMEELLRSLHSEVDAEAKRRQEEAQRCAAWDRADREGQIARYEWERTELRARIDARQVHVRTEAQAELDRQRRQRLDAEAAELRSRLAALDAQRASLGDA